MKRIAAMLMGGMLMLAGAASAQQSGAQPSGQPEDRKERAARMMDELQQRLKLTPDQAEKVRAIFQEQRDRAREMRGQREDGAAGSRRAAIQEMRQLRKDTDTKLEAVLSKEQMEEYQKFRDERRDEMRQHMRERRSDRM